MGMDAAKLAQYKMDGHVQEEHQCLAAYVVGVSQPGP